MPALFDPQLRVLRRDRAARLGPALFLHDRAFADILERLELMNRRFARALLVGCPNAAWPGQLSAVATKIEATDPGRIFAAALGAPPVREDHLEVEPGSFDLVVAIGTLDSVDDLPGALLRLALALGPGGLLIGAMAGGETLPALRSAMLEADRATGGARAHTHPRVEAAALAPLLENAGLARPVVDVDRVRIAYPKFDRLVADLRAMAATNILISRPREYLGREFLSAAQSAFSAQGTDGKTVETIEILHFAGWRGDP